MISWDNPVFLCLSSNNKQIEGSLQWRRMCLLPMVVMTVAANMTAFGQFQLLKVLSPVMVTPCPAASDTTYIKNRSKSHDFKMILHNFKISSYNFLCQRPKPVSHHSCDWDYQLVLDDGTVVKTGHTDTSGFSLTLRAFGEDSVLTACSAISEMRQTKL